MNATRSTGAIIGVIGLLMFSTLASGDDAKSPAPPGPPDPFAGCEDNLKTKVELNRKLGTPFFKKKEVRYPWWIIVHDDGHLENTMGGGPLTKEDRKFELMSNCYSTHQGDSHRMEMSEAEYDGKELRLRVWGGLPAYFGGLDIKVRGDDFQCAFDVNYPAPEGLSSQFRITKKQLHARTLRARVGERYYAWLSVEFEEGTLLKDGTLQWRPKTYKVEGYVKPIVKNQRGEGTESAMESSANFAVARRDWRRPIFIYALSVLARYPAVAAA